MITLEGWPVLMLLFNHSCGVLLLDAGCMLAENSKVRTNFSRTCFHVISWKGARKGLDSIAACTCIQRAQRGKASQCTLKKKHINTWLSMLELGFQHAHLPPADGGGLLLCCAAGCSPPLSEWLTSSSSKLHKQGQWHTVIAMSVLTVGGTASWTLVTRVGIGFYCVCVCVLLLLFCFFKGRSWRKAVPSLFVLWCSMKRWGKHCSWFCPQEFDDRDRRQQFGASW